MKSIAVIGAGITGITTAYFLAKRGHAVTVYEKHPYAAMQTSYANGGQLSVSNAEVWTTWPTLWKGFKWMFKQDAPLLFNPKPSWPKAKWIGGFLLNTIRNSYLENTHKTIDIGLQARELYYQIADEEKIKFGLLKQGILHFYRDDKYLEAARGSCALFQSHGVDRHMVTKEEVIELEPSLAPMKNRIVGGTFTPGDASGDIHVFCQELEKVLKSKYGVKFRYEQTVDGLYRTSENSVLLISNGAAGLDTAGYDNVVVCSGVDSPRVSKLIGDNLNVYPVKGYSITVTLDDASKLHTPIRSLLDEQTKIVASRIDFNKFRVAGTAELADWNYDIRADRIKPLVDWTRECFPSMNMSDVKPWAGLRPMTSNMLPIVKESKRLPGVFYNTGHGHLGWTLGAATAASVAEQIEAKS